MDKSLNFFKHRSRLKRSYALAQVSISFMDDAQKNIELGNSKSIQNIVLQMVQVPLALA